MNVRRRVIGAVAAGAAAVGLVLATPGFSSARTGDPASTGSPVPTARPAAGTFYPTDLQRILGDETAGAPLSPGTPMTVSLARDTQLPTSGVSAVVANVTVTAGASDVSVGAAPTTGTVASHPGLITVPAGATRSSLLTIPVGTLGSFDVAVTGGGATVTADVAGFYAADDTVVASQGVSGGYQPVQAHRLLDATGAAAVSGGETRLARVDLGAVTSHATALLVRVSAQDAAQAGSLVAVAPQNGTPASTGTPATTTPGPFATQSAPRPASVSFAAGAPASNLAVVPAHLDGDGKIPVSVENTSSAAVGVVVDLVGFYDDGLIGPNLRFRPLPQTRLVDTSAGLGLSALVPGSTQTVAPGASLVGDSTFGLVGVVTTTTTTTTTTSTPTALRVDAADDIADGSGAAGAIPLAVGVSSTAVQTEVGTARTVAFRAADVVGAPSAAAPPPPPAASAVQVTFDVVGSFEAYPPVTSSWSRSWVPPVSGWQIGATSG